MRRTSRRPKRRTSRGVRPNIPWNRLSVGPPPSQGGRGYSQRQWKQNWQHWYDTTFAPGTPVKLDRSQGHPLHGGLPDGARAVVEWEPRFDASAGDDLIRVLVTDARDASGLQTPHVGHYLDEYVYLWEPLVDNWAQRSSGRRTSRHALPRSQRSWLKPNIPLRDLTVPPPDPSNARALRHWIMTTFAVGTPVQLVSLDRGQRRGLAGIGEAKGRVSYIDPAMELVHLQFTDLRDVNGMEVAPAAYDALNDLFNGRGFALSWKQLAVDEELWVEPLVDHWATRQGAPLGRQQLPRSQRSWMKPNPYREPSPPPPHVCRRWRLSYTPPHYFGWQCANCRRYAGFIKEWDLDRKFPDARVGQVVEL